MITTCLSVALAAAMYLTTTCPTSSYSPLPLTQTLPFGKWVGYVVRKNTSLEEIAKDKYGSEEYWKNIWNDNPDIEDPEDIEEGTFLRIRSASPSASVALDPELAERVEDMEAEVYIQPAVQPVTQPQQMAPAPQVLTEEQLNFLGSCEAGMNPTRNSGNGYYGAFQFSYGTWKRMNTGYERADLAPIEVQKDAVQRLVQRSSIFTQFPACAYRMRGAGLI